MCYFCVENDAAFCLCACVQLRQMAVFQRESDSRCLISVELFSCPFIAPSFPPIKYDTIWSFSKLALNLCMWKKYSAQRHLATVPSAAFPGHYCAAERAIPVQTESSVELSVRRINDRGGCCGNTRKILLKHSGEIFTKVRSMVKFFCFFLNYTCLH